MRAADLPIAGSVTAVSASTAHHFSKENTREIELLTGLGVKGDSHMGTTVQHLVRMREDPAKPNMRQVHLIHEELFAQLRGQGFSLAPGAIGENITTRGIALLDLPHAAKLHIGDTAVVEVTGLRNPCRQLDTYQQGLMAALIERTADGAIKRKSGIMGIVLAGGMVRAGDSIRVELPPPPHRPMDRV